MAAAPFRPGAGAPGPNGGAILPGLPGRGRDERREARGAADHALSTRKDAEGCTASWYRRATLNRPPGRAALAFIFVTVVLDVLALGIVIPVLPKLVASFEGGDMARAAETFGIFMTAWGLMQFLSMPFVGALSDRFGRRPVILISCFGLGCDYFLMAWAPTLGWLLLGRIVSGITASSFATAFA